MITISLWTTEESRPSDSSIAVITLKISHIFNNTHTAINSDLSTITSSKAYKGKNGGWLPLGVIAQWQSTQAAQARGPGFDSQRRHFSFQALAVSKVYGQ